MDVSPPPSSRISFVKRPVNKNTCLPGMLPSVVVAPVDLRQAYRAAEASNREMPPLPTPGYRLFRVGAGDHAWVDLPAGPDAYAIVGRHTQCDLRLEGDDEIALRHLLVRAKMAPGGDVPMLRMLDLHTTLGFRLEDGDSERAASVVGPVAVHVGRLALVALPSSTTALPSELPPAFVEPVGSSPYRSPPSERQHEQAPAHAVRHWTHVSLMPEAPSLHQARVTLVGATVHPLEPTLAPYGFSRITLERDGHGQCVDIADEELEAGILIGRASKCDRRFAELLDDNVSRVHLLITREEGATVTFDLASMNGTRFHGRRTRRFALPDAGATLALGVGGVCLRWHARARPRARP
jgi:hypothetical protein